MSVEVGVRRLKNELSEYLTRVERGEIITVTRRGKAVARVIPAGISPGLARLIAEGRVRWAGGEPRLPTPVRLKGAGMSMAEYVAEGRR